MKSIFRIIFLRFLVMLALSFLGTLVTRSIITRSQTVEANATLLQSQMQHALDLYRKGGSQDLAFYLSRIGAAQRADVYIIDRTGADLVDGVNRSELLKQEDPGFQIPNLGRTSQTQVITSSDRSHSMIIKARSRFNFKEFLSYYIWTFFSILLLSWWLAIALGSPLRKLRLAVEEFGRGDLSSRARSARKDEIGDLASSFDRMADRIENLLTTERRLLQDISHELRSPLARLSCAIEIARNRGDGDETIARIHKESQKLNSLVNQLLEVASAEGDPTGIRREQVSLNDLLAGLIDDSQIEAERKQCRVTFEEKAQVTLSGDVELLSRAAENVLRNAIRYAPSRTHVEVELAAKNGSAIIKVRDYGPGVPDEFLTRIFKPFFRVESHRGSEGAGLGLALAERAVSLHQGTINAQNASPGLLINIELPLDSKSTVIEAAASGQDMPSNTLAEPRA